MGTFNPGRYAAIDIGTVTCRMLVADVDSEGRITQLAKKYAICNLGEEVDATGRLKPEAMDRVCAALDSYQAVLRNLEAEGAPITVTTMATSAARDAENGAVFQERLALHGLPLSIIPGTEEAALSFLGAASDFPGQAILVADIGGGSTEIAYGAAGQNPSILHSFNIGCRRVTERFFHSDPPSPAEIEAARQWIRETWGPYFDGWMAEGMAFDQLICVAGTATTAVSVRDEMVVYNSEKVHLSPVTGDELGAVFRKLDIPLAQRRKVVGLDPGRAPVIVAGMVILQELLRAAQTWYFTASESDILKGIILHTARTA